MTSGTAYTIADGEGFPEVTGGAAQCSAVEQTNLSLIPFPHGNLLTHLRATPDPENVRKYFRALRRAQRDIDLRPELYTHYYQKEFPVRFHDQMDTRRWGPGERLVFEPYSKQTFDESFEWIEQHGIFPRSGMGSGKYESAIFTQAAE